MGGRLSSQDLRQDGYEVRYMDVIRGKDLRYPVENFAPEHQEQNKIEHRTSPFTARLALTKLQTVFSDGYRMISRYISLRAWGKAAGSTARFRDPSPIERLLIHESGNYPTGNNRPGSES